MRTFSVLQRFHAFLSNWPHSFSRLFAITRDVVWNRIHLLDLLEIYGIASAPHWRMRAQPQYGFLPGFAPVAVE